MNSIRGSWGWQLLVSTLIVGGVVTSGNCALGQVVGDTSLGAESSVVTPNVNINGLPADRIDGGATRGANLFHSFLEFNVGIGQQVYFSNPPGIENIFSRVTGTDPSDILGTLGVTGNANLFLLNPNGIIFGRNASLDVGGSFYATTASGIQFGNGGEFSATNPQALSSLLTINPSAFFFTARANQGGIINQSRVTQTVVGTPTDGLKVPNGQTLLLLGGNVTNDDGRLIARGGRVEIGAVAGPGTVGLNPNGSLSVPDGMQRADVVFTNRASSNRSGIDVRYGNGGDIGITAGNISLFSGSQLRAGIASGLGTPESQGGDITVNATGEIRMTGDDSRMANDVRENASGKAGNLMITTNSLVVTDGAQLSASTFGIGDAGNVVIVADHVSFSGRRADEGGPSAAFSRVEYEAQGNGGTVQIFTNVLEMTKGAALFTSTEGIGNAGNLVIVARDRVSFDGISPRRGVPSAGYSSVSSDARGNGGDVTITTESLFVTNGALLSAATAGQGHAGNIRINTESLFVTNGALLSAETFGQGDAGNIRINAADSITLAGSGSDGFSSGLFTATWNEASGQGGEIIVDTDALRIQDTAVMNAQTFNANNGGSITINANTFEAVNGGQVLTTTLSSGRAGKITLNVTDSVSLSGSDPNYANRLTQSGRDVVSGEDAASGLFANTSEDSTGQGGDLSITSGQLVIQDGAQVTASSRGTGDAGNIINITTRSLRLDNGSITTTSRSGQGGNIDKLQVQDLLLMRNGSRISTSAGTDQNGGGDGGNITIDISNGFIVAVPKEDSDITANAFKGRGGNINITTQGIYGLQLRPRLTPLSDITASSDFGVNGTVQINTPDVDPSRGLTNLPTEPVDASSQIAQTCPTGEKAIQNQFIITGRGGLPDDPNQMLYTDTVWTDLRLPSQRSETRSNSPEAELTTNSKAVPLVEATGWVMNDKGQVVLTASAPAVTPQSPGLMPPTCPIP